MNRGAMAKVERITTQKEVKCTIGGNYSNFIEILTFCSYFYQIRKIQH